MKKTDFVQVGVTPEGKPVMSGVFSFYESHGIPLEIIFMSFIDKGLVPSWIDLYRDMRSSGMKHDRIIIKLQDAISDSFGPEWSEHVILQLNKVFSEK